MPFSPIISLMLTLDVLFGRGTGSNMHTGNIRFRALIKKYKPIYRDTPKKLKPSVSTKVVAMWRAQDPPGRFLTRSDRYQGSRRTFYDVGDAAARRKAAQCLREKSSRERIEIAVAGKLSAAEASEAHADDLDESAEEEDNLIVKGGEQEENLLGCSQPLNVESADDLEQQEETGSEIAPLKTAFMLSSEMTSSKEEAKSAPDELASAEGLSFLCQLSSKEESSLMFPSLKSMNQVSNKLKLAGAAFMSDNEPLSLSGVFGSRQIEREDSDSPFTMSGIDFGDGGESDGGLCFPSLGSGSSAFPSLGDASLDFPALNEPAPTAIAAAVEAKTDALYNIRNSVPTAASLLTTNLFDD